MLDTVHLFTRDYVLREDIDWEEPGRRVKGEFILKNRHINRSPFVFEEMRDGKFFVRASLPKLLHKSNLFELRDEEYKKTLKALEEGVQSVCEDSEPLESWRVSRVDFCSNLQVKEHPIDYIHTLSEFNIARRDTSITNHKTILFKNKKRQFTAYNKIAELTDQAKKKKDPYLKSLVQGLEEDIVRLETRLLGSESVERVFSKRDTREVHLELVWGQEKSIAILIDDLRRLTRVKPEQLKLSFKENDELLAYHLQRSARNGFNNFLADKGTGQLLRDFGSDYETLKDWLMKHFPKATVYRLLRKVRESQVRVLQPSKKELLSELNELLIKKAS